MSNQTQDPQVRASFNVKKEVLDEFRKEVVKKHGRLWGVLCLEFEKALNARLAELKTENHSD